MLLTVEHALAGVGCLSFAISFALLFCEGDMAFVELLI